MASVSWVTEDQFLCSVCLEVFTDPVTTSCGHSFCKACINRYWDNSILCQCPVCKEDFSTRPRLKVSTCLFEMVAPFKKKSQNEILAVGGDVVCDICSEAKAFKSCLVCLASYCQRHLEPHLTIPRLKRHRMIEPLENLEERLCAEHDKPLELFCRDDSEFICLQCIYSDHTSHNAAPLKGRGEMEQEHVKNMIEERQLKMEEIQNFVETSRKNSVRGIQNGVEVCDELIEHVQQSLKEFKQNIEEEQNDQEKHATEWIQELETEISELEKRKSEMEKLWCAEDHFHFLQIFIFDKLAPAVQDWTEVVPKAPSYDGRVAKAVAKLQDRLDEVIKEVLRDELQKKVKFSEDVSLDPDTAYPKLILSDDHKQVHSSDYNEDLPDNPKRFSLHPCVVGKQTFSTGRLYFEVQVQEKTYWFVGMVKESTKRKEVLTPKPQNGLWLLSFKNGKYLAHDYPLCELNLKIAPKTIGIFVDYEEGIVSFYDVDTAGLIYSFTLCSFTEDLLPLLNPGNNDNGNNSAPLVINPQTT